jgi:DNA polymerase I-like protein with 3'-5' exonuclease and polymerase domains
VALAANNTKEGSRQRQAIEQILKVRQIDTNLGYLEAEPDYDGKMRTSVRITGTETGRTSNNILKPPVRPTKVGLPFQTLPSHGPYAKVIRSIFISKPEDYLLAVDLRQAEARIVAFLANDLAGLEEFDTTDKYKRVASYIMEIPIERVDKDKRYVGKKGLLSYGYGIAKRRLMLDTNSEAKKAGININISERDAGLYLQRLDRLYPRIKEVFQSEVMAACIRDRRTLVNPFGRKRTFYGELKPEEVYATIPQSIPPDHLRRCYFNMEKNVLWDRNKIRLWAERHDELCFHVKRGYETIIVPIIVQELTRSINFQSCSLPRGELSIPCSVTIGTNFRDMEEYKYE